MIYELQAYDDDSRWVTLMTWHETYPDMDEIELNFDAFTKQRIVRVENNFYDADF